MARTAALSKLMKALSGFLLLFVPLTVGFAADDHDTAKWLKDAGAIIPLEKILEVMREEHADRLLEVKLLRNWQGRLVYYVEFVDAQGVVRYVQYDATRGTLLHMPEDPMR